MSEPLAGKKAVLPAFSLTETCSESDPGAIRRTIPAVGERPAQTYFIRSVAAEVEAGRSDAAKWVRQEFNLFPLVLDHDGQPWDVAVIYILSKLQGDPASV